jgi:hypothetical protein
VRAFREGLTYFTRALDLWDEVDDPAAAGLTRPDLLAAAARCAHDAGEHETPCGSWRRRSPRPRATTWWPGRCCTRRSAPTWTGSTAPAPCAPSPRPTTCSRPATRSPSGPGSPRPWPTRCRSAGSTPTRRRCGRRR